MSCTYYGDTPLLPMPSWEDTYCRQFYAQSPQFYNPFPGSIPCRDGYESSEDKLYKYGNEFDPNMHYRPSYYDDLYDNVDQRVTTCEPEEVFSPHSRYTSFNDIPSTYRGDMRVPPTHKMEFQKSPTSASGSGRRNLSKLLHKGYNFDKTQYLLFYTYSELQGSSDDIIWIDEAKGIFFINKPDSFAQKWGEYKGIHKMDYQKVSRSFRYYYKQKNLLKKVEGKLRQYRWDLKALEALKNSFNQGTPLRDLNKPIKKKTPNMLLSN